MTFDWQNLTAIAIVAIAATYVARPLFAGKKAKAGHCHGCSTCAAEQPAVISPESLLAGSTLDQRSK